MAASVSIWLRQFRPAFQRQYGGPPDPAADLDLIDLLRAADKRRQSSQPPKAPNRDSRTAG